MSISVHIYDGGAGDAPAGSAPAGTLAAAVPQVGGEMPAAGALALDAGPPDAALVQEVEAALLLARAAATVGDAGGDGDAGAAPA